MLTAHNVRPEAAASYYEQEDSYYAQEQSACGSRWYGNLAEQVCLEGAVEAEDFRRFIHGRAPNGVRIRGVNNVGTKTRGGYDLTFSAPKSVSLQALVWNDTRVIKAHREAVEAVLKEIELNHSLVEIRTGGKRVKEITGKLAIATFTHATSRKMDPQLHTHAIIMNTSYCSDGKWRALRNESFFRDSRRDLGVQYQHELADRLQQIGYGVTWKPNDTFDITGYSREQLRAFSQRTEEIEAIAHQKGVKGWREVKHISLQNRPAKELEDPQKLRQQWRNRAQDVDLHNPRLHIVQDTVVSIPQRDEPQGIERTTAETAAGQSHQRDDVDTLHPQERTERVHRGPHRRTQKQRATSISQWQSAPQLKESLQALAQSIGQIREEQWLAVSEFPQQIAALAVEVNAMEAPRWPGMDTLAQQIQTNVDEQVLSESFELLTDTLKNLEHRVEQSIQTTVAEQASNAVNQWHQEQRLVEAMAAGDKVQARNILQQVSGKPDLRPQMKELVQALSGWQEQQLVSEAAMQFSQIVERSRGLNLMVEAISRQQAMLETAQAITTISNKLQQWQHYPQMAQLAEAIQQQQDAGVLLENGLTDKLNHIGRQFEHMLSWPPSLEGVQELAKAIHHTQQNAAIAQHMQALDGLQNQVEQWVEQQPDIQQLSAMVRNLRGAVSSEALENLTQQMKNMGIDVTPKPQKKVKPLVEQPLLKKDRLEAEAKIPNQAPQQPEKTGPVWSPQRLQALEYLRPKYIEPKHWIELVKDSSIHPRIAAKYFWSLDGPESKEYLLNYAMGQFTGHGVQHTTEKVAKFLARYEHLEAGGLWCEGRPYQGEPWGQLKPNTPRVEDKNLPRYVIKLKSGRVLHREKPADYKPDLKTLNYESIPKAEEHLVSHRSHFAFAKDIDDIKNETKEVWITEGAKKGAAIYTRGIDAIALNGVNGGYSNDEDEQRSLDGHLKQYNWQNRIVVLCFDKDPSEKTSTLRNVAVGMHRLGRLLEQQGARVEVAEMPGHETGKLGIDDWLARGNRLNDLSYSTLDEWAQESPWLDKELAAYEYEIEQDEGFEYGD